MATDGHIGKLEAQITALSSALAHLGQGTDLRDIIRIIHNPGWTTPAEFAFMTAMLTSLDAQVAQVGRQILAMKDAATQVR